MRSKIQKPCRICGKLFTPCSDCENDKTMFRWKRIACSQKCAKEYFAKVEASRQPKGESTDPQPVRTGDLDINYLLKIFLGVKNINMISIYPNSILLLKQTENNIISQLRGFLEI